MSRASRASALGVPSYVPLDQLTAQVRTVRDARSVTARVFTAEEHASNHCHVGNTELSVRVMLDWFDALDRQTVLTS